MKRLLAFFTCLSAFSAYAQDRIENFETKRVDIFKNGSAFFMLDGWLKLSKGEGIVRPVPECSFGTLWMAALDKNVQISEIRSTDLWDVKTRSAASVSEILKANLGKTIVWTRIGEAKQTAAGTLQDVLGTDDRLVAILKSGPDVVVLPVSSYYDQLAFAEGYQNLTRDSIRTKALTVRTTSSQGEAAIRMVYFRSGIGWTPAYRVELLDDKKAQVVLSATVVNDAQDIVNGQINLVVGYPHFLYTNTQSPLSSSQSFYEFLQSLSGGEYQPYRSVTALANQSMYLGAEEITVADYGNVAAVEGKAEEDLFFYDLKNVTLKKGERAQLSLFSAAVPYEHVFEVRLPNAMNESSYEPREKTPYEVWHSVKLENTTSVPWTTGSGFTVQNDKPLGQDILRYTAVKSSVNLKITQSPDIHVTDSEKEVDRKQDAHKKDGYYYDLVSVEGEITVHNYKEKDVVLTVSRPVTGKFLSGTPQPRVVPKTKIGKPVNPESEVTWDVPVKAGKELVLTYRYEAYLRH
jgi:hypothetical protein